MSLIQAEQDRLVIAQQIWMPNTLKTIIMKNTRYDSQNCKINSKSIRASSTRQQGKLNFKTNALRSSIALITGEGNLFGENLSNCYFPSLLFLITTFECTRVKERASSP